MEVLKIATAGSVDDGKSTLIGRILYDTKSLTDDKLEAIEKKSQSRGYDYLDFSLATDGLVAEREQGITIDVAHIYFSTENRSYIIADTPGHVEYTRNMVTGASTSQASVILVDARNGVIEQTKRHFFINNLLRVKDIIVAVNKMDLVDFDESKFDRIRSDVEKLAAQANYKNQSITFIPVSALKGDNVVYRSENTPWYTGKTLMEHFESIENQDVYETADARFPVQAVIRPKQADYHDYRAYAGKLYGNDLSVGDEVTILPSMTSTKIKEIQFFGSTYDTAKRGSSISLSLEDDVNVSRGDTIVRSESIPRSGKELNATICWMDRNPMRLASRYELQHGTNKIMAKIKAINSVLEVQSNQQSHSVDNLVLNDIGTVSMQLNKTLFFDSYEKNKSTGCFILIDKQTNTTAGVGFIE